MMHDVFKPRRLETFTGCLGNPPSLHSPMIRSRYRHRSGGQLGHRDLRSRRCQCSNQLGPILDGACSLESTIAHYWHIERSGGLRHPGFGPRSLWNLILPSHFVDQTRFRMLLLLRRTGCAVFERQCSRWSEKRPNWPKQTSFLPVCQNQTLSGMIPLTCVICDQPDVHALMNQT